MIRFIQSFNMITLVFVVNLCSMFFITDKVNLLIMCSLFILTTCISILKREKKIKINLIFRILTALIFYIILITLINISQSNVSYIFRIVLTVGLGIQIKYIFGESYIQKGLIRINRLMIILNIYGIIEFITKQNYFLDFYQDETFKNYAIWFTNETYRTSNMFGHAIVYATILLILFWINIYLEKNNRIRIFNTCIILFNIYATKSRSIWIALAITVGIYLIKRYIKGRKSTKKNERRNNYLSICIGILFSVIMISSKLVRKIIENITQRFMEIYTNSNDISAAQRLGTIQNIGEIMYSSGIFRFIFGYGAGSSVNIMLLTTVIINGFTTTDNQYISFFIDFGIIGIMMLLLLNLVFVFYYFTTDKESNILIILIGLGISMFFYELYNWKVVSSLYFILLGASSVRKIEEE